MQLLPSRPTVFLLAAVLMSATALIGCDSAGFEENDSSDQAQVNVQVTSGASTSGMATFGEPRSSAAEIEGALVTIASIELVGEDVRHTLSDEEQEIDLLELEGAAEDLALGEVPPGEYDRLLLKVTSTDLVLSDGSTPNLKIPSGKIKLLLPDFEIEDEGDEAEVTVEFDIEKSFVKAGNSGKYIFKPTVRAQSVELNDEELNEEVEIAGSVTAYAEGESVEVEGIPFAITTNTEIGDDEELVLEEGQAVELEGAQADDGTYVAQEIEAREDAEEEGAVLEVPLDEVRPDENVLVLLGMPFEADADTEFDGFNALADLNGSNRVEVAFAYEESTDTYRLLKIESESSEEENDDGEDDDEGNEAAEVIGRITSEVQDSAIAVEDLSFAVTGGTEVDGADGPEELDAGQHVKLKATYTEGGTLVATEIEVEDEEEENATIETFVESVSEGTLTLLETSFVVDDATELEDIDALSDLEQGDEVEVAFSYDADTYRALKIEADSSGDED